MENKAYLSDLSILLGVSIDQLTDGFSLRDNQLWDSLSVISTIGLIDNHYHIAVKGDELDQCETLGDIFKLIYKKSNGNSDTYSLGAN